MARPQLRIYYGPQEHAATKGLEIQPEPGRVNIPLRDVFPVLADAVRGASVIVLVTRWPEFAALPDLIAGMDPPPLVVDGRRVLDRSRIPRYEGIGR